MRIISHRGNLHGRDPARENTPQYVEEAVAAGMHVAVDVRVDTASGGFWLVGGDGTLHPVPTEFLTRGCIWAIGSCLPDTLNRMEHRRDIEHVLQNDGETSAVICCPGFETGMAVALLASRGLNRGITLCTDFAWAWRGVATATPMPSLSVPRIALLHSGRSSLAPFAVLYALTHPEHSVSLVEDPDASAADLLRTSEECHGRGQLVCVTRRPAFLPEFSHLHPPADDMRLRVMVPCRDRSGGVNLNMAVGTPESIRVYCHALALWNPGTGMSLNQSTRVLLQAAEVVIEEFDRGDAP